MPTEITRPVGARSPEPAPRPIIPRGVIIGAGLLMIFTIIVAALSHRAGIYHVTTPPTTAVASRDLFFADQHNGGVLVTDAKTGKRVAMIEPTTGGFLRGIMRGLVREHRLNDQPVGTAFRLTHWADGRLSIADPTTGESFDLEAFGSTNELAFAKLLEEDDTKAGVQASTSAPATQAPVVGAPKDTAKTGAQAR